MALPLAGRPADKALPLEAGERRFKKAKLVSPALQLRKTTCGGSSALRWGSQKYDEIPGEGQGKSDVDVKLGGTRNRYEDEDPIAPQMFEEACVTSRCQTTDGKSIIKNPRRKRTHVQSGVNMLLLKDKDLQMVFTMPMTLEALTRRRDYQG